MFAEARPKLDFVQSTAVLTAKLTAKPADEDGRLYTVMVRSLELAGVMDTGVRH